MHLARLGEGALLALGELRANRGRSSLTILGVVIGVATVMAMSAVISGVRTAILSEIEASGPRNFSVMRLNPYGVRVVSDAQWWLRNPSITLEEIGRIARLPSLRGAIPLLAANVGYSFRGHEVPDQIVYGRSAGWQRVTSWRLTSGRDLLPADVRAGHAVVLLSNQLAGQIFGAVAPLGQHIRIDHQEFQVIGTFATPQRPFAGRERQIGIVPYTAAVKYLRVDRDWMQVDAAPLAEVSQQAAMEEVTSLLRTMRHLHPREPNNFALVTADEVARAFEQLSGIFFLVLIALSSVALSVGGVGVVATMTITVTERTREIGIRKALGATRREILWQFLVEAVTVTFVGATIGMLLGGGGALLAAAISPIPARVPLFGLVAALLMTVLAGIAFGIWPAWRAAHMDPVEALRYE